MSWLCHCLCDLEQVSHFLSRGLSFPVTKRERGWTQRCVRSFQYPGFSANQQPKQIQNSQVFLPLLEPQGWLRRGTPACLPPQSSPPSILQSFLRKVGADAKAASRQRNNVDDRPGAPTAAATQLWQEERSQTCLTSKPQPWKEHWSPLTNVDPGPKLSFSHRKWTHLEGAFVRVEDPNVLAHTFSVLLLFSEELMCLKREIDQSLWILDKRRELEWPCLGSDANFQGHLGPIT